MFDPHGRKALTAGQSRDIPAYVSCLWSAYEILGDDRECFPVLHRVYINPALARHDGLCWLMEQQRQDGAAVDEYVPDMSYEMENGGRCFRYRTPDDICEEIEGRYWIFTTLHDLY
jgi:hypothetical protein